MKRLMIVLSLVAVICCVGFAEENASANMKYRFASGGFWTCGSDFCGGFGEFGINILPTEKHFVLRDCIYVQGSGGYLAKNAGLEFGGLEIGDKLILGGRTNCPGFIVRGYGFTSIGLGFFSCEGHSFGSKPLLINLGFGGGFEFQYAKYSAFVVEFGGLNRLLVGGSKEGFQDYSKSSPTLTIGFRSFM